MNNSVFLKTIPVKHILIVDDMEDIREFLVSIFSGQARVSTAVDGAEALRMVNNNHYDLIISDIEMPRLNGLDFYAHAVRKNRHLRKKFMFFTGSIDAGMRSFIQRQRLFCLPKPSTIHEIKYKAKLILDRN